MLNIAGYWAPWLQVKSKMLEYLLMGLVDSFV